MKARLISAAVGMCLAANAVWAEVSVPLQSGGTWLDIRENMVADYQSLQDGVGVLELHIPVRAHDAAIVPVRIKQLQDHRIDRLKLIIDENPAPMAAEFSFGPDMYPLQLETRVRVERYSNLRVIATLDTGKDYMVGGFIKASGGCSAPAGKDPAAFAKTFGQIKVKQFSGGDTVREAQIMIRHPNYSGLQRDQITHLFEPVNFIHALEVLQGDSLLFRMEGGISISENPTFRFQYRDNGSRSIQVRAMDTDGNLFQKEIIKQLF